MLEILQFIFSSFWIWLGAVILVSTITGGMRRWALAFLSSLDKRK